MASRKEQKEALRREREQREHAAKEAERRRRLVGYGAGGALALAAVVAVIVLLVTGGGGGDGSGGGTRGGDLFPSGGKVPDRRITDLKKAAGGASCVLRSYKATSREHITDINQKVHYSSNPPTSGRHYYVPANDGAYSKAPPDVAAVHALEHGRIDIWFKPRLPRARRAALKALFDSENGYQLLLMPRPNMTYQLAATAWGREPLPNGRGYLLGCPTFGNGVFDALRAFIDAHRSQGPEPVP
ncbi:MAG: DUF3105 domain-containing protein [Thermoleophilaceae bacterium]